MNKIGSNVFVPRSDNHIMTKYQYWLFAFVALVPLILGSAFAQTQTVNPNDIENDIADKVNQYRISKGLKPLIQDSSIEFVVKKHLTDLEKTGLFQHNTPFTSKNSIERSGFKECGISEDLAKHKQVKTQSAKLKSDITKFNQNYQAAKFQKGNISLQNWLIQNKPLILDQRAKLFDQIDYVNLAIKQGRIGIGYSEVLGQKQDLTQVDYDQFAQESLDGWISSSEHNKELLGYHEKMGISVLIDSNNNRVLTGINFC